METVLDVLVTKSRQIDVIANINFVSFICFILLRIIIVKTF